MSCNTKLTFLWCNDNYLTSLNLDNQTQLQTLNCNGNRLSSLDVSNNPQLSSLSCDNNQLSNVNLQGCTALKQFYCNANELTSLDISTNRELQSLQLWRNQLKSISLSQNTKLVSVNLSANHSLSDFTLGNMQYLERLKIQNTSISQLDIRNAPLLLKIYKDGTRIEFYGDGRVAESGTGVFYGYTYDDYYPHPGDTEAIKLCLLCFNTNVSIVR